MNYLARNLDNLIVLIIAGLAIISVELDGKLRIISGFILVSLLPGYALVNLVADALIFKWIMRSGLLIMTIIKFAEIVSGVFLSLTIVPLIGLFLSFSGLGFTLVTMIYSLSFIVAVSTVMDIFVRRKYSKMISNNFTNNNLTFKV
ncbi:MAG: DUF1616 domain-containing protein [archaeon]|nr:DUF1616 domain-containing protein [archaeon]